MEYSVDIQQEDFDPGTEIEALKVISKDCGAIVTFIGQMREFLPPETGRSATSSMLIEHYPGMAEKEIEQIIARAGERWSLYGIRVVHRVGTFYPADSIVLVGVASAHRDEAFDAARFIMDFLKTRAPFWKKEIWRDHENKLDGNGEWVEARDSDITNVSNWGQD